MVKRPITQPAFGGAMSHWLKPQPQTPTLQLLHKRYHVRGGGERAPTCGESYPSFGWCLLRIVVACIMALVTELFQTFPEPTLELENSEKPWNVQLQSWIWKCPAADRNSYFFPKSGKVWKFCRSSPLISLLKLIIKFCINLVSKKRIGFQRGYLIPAM